jgi:hypothetical protein
MAVAHAKVLVTFFTQALFFSERERAAAAECVHLLQSVKESVCVILSVSAVTNELLGLLPQAYIHTRLISACIHTYIHTYIFSFFIMMTKSLLKDQALKLL